ncbi:MAG: metalloregulator ArsR/SmtB family transcription factor, partial [Coriobacteriia bacterium]|nr:metalloregulator ArsR/SmtB family transcription factor [Coriobacteriia bacterium]
VLPVRSMSSYAKDKAALYEQFARVGKALCSARRLEIVDLLLQADRTVEGLARETGMSVANTSQHLQVLKQARVVDSERSGNHVIYRVASEYVGGLLTSIQQFAEAGLAEVDAITRRFHEGRRDMEAVDRAQLMSRAQAGDVIVLDVRPRTEYEAGHLPFAESLPLEQLEYRLASLPRDRQIVAYCRGPYCVLAVEAVERLREKGFDAVRLKDGVREWQEYGLPIEHEKATSR